jgi:hypothetical protein
MVHGFRVVALQRFDFFSYTVFLFLSGSLIIQINVLDLNGIDHRAGTGQLVVMDHASPLAV